MKSPATLWAVTISGLQHRQLNGFGALVSLNTFFRSATFSILNKCAKKYCFVCLVATLTAACSSISRTAAPPATPIDYRKIVSDGAPAPMTKGAQVSELRSTGGAQPGDWIACVKSDTAPYIGLFAVFIEDEKVKDFRRAIGIDQCESAMYSPLPPTPPPPQEKDEPRKHNKANSKSRPSNSAD
jgi:hypothetical protein